MPGCGLVLYGRAPGVLSWGWGQGDAAFSIGKGGADLSGRTNPIGTMGSVGVHTMGLAVSEFGCIVSGFTASE